MSLFTNSFRNLSQQQYEDDSVKVYYKSDMKQYAKIRYNRGTTIGQIINELIKELNLNGKLQYQLYIITHQKNEPSQGGISIKRKLRKNEQPFRILFFTKTFKYSFYLDYMFSQLSQNIQDSHINQNENYQLTKYDKEFKIVKLTKNGSQKKIRIKINSQGAALCQEGNKKWKSLFNTLIVNLILSKTFNKLIYQYTKNTEIKCKMNSQDNIIQNCTRQIMQQIEFNCYEFTQSKQMMKENPNFKSFIEIYKITQVNQDITAIQNDDLIVNIIQFKESILETMSILPREQFRKALIVFNAQFKYTASQKIENQIEEQNSLLNSLEDILVSEEDMKKFNQFLS
ncbi:unnamed protein product [Paramecium sonneborni]|uniref:Ras-associating domain-containing protein n=1 Tax=Paramecium sonneborni TaxID=65129 RepID=A0A8S1M733_9CILI|nr:unnamed protein product [Paramecium sonneborni]